MSCYLPAFSSHKPAPAGLESLHLPEERLKVQDIARYRCGLKRFLRRSGILFHPEASTESLEQLCALLAAAQANHP